MKPELSGKKILVTGASGYLASNLIPLLQDIDCRILCLSRTGTHFSSAPGKARAEDVTGDIGERGLWERALDGVDVVFHFAAQTSVYRANDNPQADLNVNVLPLVHLLETSRIRGRRVDVLLAGTATEAGIPARLPVDESPPDIPVTLYDLHKLMAEQYLEYYVRLGLARGAALRLSNVYGPGPQSSSAERGMLNQMIRKALRSEPLAVYGRAEYVRDYIYVEDAARAFLDAASSLARINGRHFVVGSGEGHTIAEAVGAVADRVAAHTGRRAPVTHIDPPPGLSPIETRNFVADSTLFTRSTGWKARTRLIEGIDQTIERLLAEERLSSKARLPAEP